MKISDSVYFYPGKDRSRSNAYIIRDKGKQILIDLDKSRSIEELWMDLEKDGLKLLDTNEIWLTHTHPDHCKVGFLAEKLDCPVRCHPEGIPLIRAKAPWNVLFEKNKFLAGWLRKQIYPLPDFVYELFYRSLYGGWRPIRTEKIQPFQANEIVGLGGVKVKVLFLPGHSEDGVNFWLEKDKVLISGDLVRSEKKVGFPCLNTFQADFNETVKTLTFIKGIPIRVLAPGHGPLVKGESKIKELVETNLKTCRYLKKKAIHFFSQNYYNVLLKNFVDEIGDFWLDTIERRERLHWAYCLYEALHKDGTINV